MEVAQPDCPPDGLVPGTVAGEGTGEYPFNGIQSHPADRGTGGGCGGGRVGGGGWRGAVGCSGTNKWSTYEGGGRMEKERKDGATSTGECCDLVGAGIPSILQLGNNQ